MASAAVIRKKKALGDPPPVFKDYDAACAAFSWEKVARGLGVPIEGPLNLGGLAASRGGSIYWFGSDGEQEHYGPAEVAARSARFANSLRGLGLNAGDRVVFMTRAVPELCFGILGALRMGVAVSVLGLQRNLDALRNVVSRTAASVVVIEPVSKPIVDMVRKTVPSLKHVVFIKRGPKRMATRHGEILWNDLCDTAEAEFQDVPLPPTDPAWIHYTELAMSGAVAAHRAAFMLASSSALALDMRRGDGVVTLAVPGEPLFVPYTLLAPLLMGAKTFLFEDPVRFEGYGRFKEAVNVWYSSSRAIDVVLRLQPGLSRILERCRHISVTYPYDASFVIMTEGSYGSPLHPTWWARELGAIHTAEFRACDIKPGSIGRPLPGVEMSVEPGTNRLAVKISPTTPFTGYWEGPGHTQRRVKDGWFITDHKVDVDAEGYAWIVS